MINPALPKLHQPRRGSFKQLFWNKPAFNQIRIKQQIRIQRIKKIEEAARVSC